MKEVKADRQTTLEEHLEGKEYIRDETRRPTQGGSGGGKLSEKVGTPRDEEKRAFERPAGATRVRKSDKQK